MSRNCKNCMVYMHHGVRHRKTGVLIKLFRGFCNTVESSELPDWFKFPQGEQFNDTDSEEDFVLPTNQESLLAITTKKKVGYRKSYHRTMLPDSIDVDADKISNVLTMKLKSTGAVVQAIDSCSVRVSKGLVDKILKRFGNDWVPALAFFKWASTQTGYKHSADSYDMMVDILGKSKQFNAMWGLIEEMVQLGNLVSLETMTKVMRRLAGAGRWSDTIKFFHDIECFGIRKDTKSMNVLLDTLCKERSVRRAMDAFNEVRREIPPNASSYNILIHGWCKARKLEEAQQTLEDMRRFGFSPCVISYTSLIEAFCIEKNFQKVNTILDDMHAQQCPPNVVTYTIIMHSLGKANEIIKALDIFDKMKKNGCQPDTLFYNSLIYVLGRAGRLKASHDVYEEMRKNGISLNVTTYNTLISAACAYSQDETALKLLLEMEQSSCNPDIKTYAPLLKLCCRRKWMKILFYLLAHMFKMDISIDLGTYTLLVRGLCHNGKLEQSCMFFKEMVLKGLLPKQYTYSLLLEALERKNMDKAKVKVQQWMMLAQSMNQPSYSTHAQIACQSTEIHNESV